jgi:uncharacterized protein (TIGR02302 family)
MTEGQESDRRTVPIRLDERAIRTRVARAVARARLALVWESLWPLVLPFLLVVALYLIVSWFGLWSVVPNPVRIGGLVLFGVAAVVSLLLPLRTRIPRYASGLSRVERVTGIPHRPATAANDRLASAPTDPTAVALWNAHRTRLLGRLGRLRAGWPSPGVQRRDPYALRFLVLILLVVAFVYSGPSRNGRLTESLNGPVETVPQILARIDAWATPPTYTGRPPVFLTGQAGRPSGSSLKVPEGTVVTVRIAGADGLSVFTTTAAGETEVLAVGTPTEPQAPGVAPVRRTTTIDRPSEYRMPLAEPTTVAIRGQGGEDLFWQFAVELDQPPQIALNSEPTVNQSGALTLAYSVRDDYGVISAEARFAAAEEFGDGDETARPLVEAPRFALSLPQMRAREGGAETTQDLLSHPWAGGRVTVQLVARDESGQEGFSEPFEMTLPERGFSKPLARALVEERRILAFDANQSDQVAEALDALTIAPDRFIPQTDAYLGMRAAYHRTVRAHDDDVLRSVLDLLWDIALGLEDSDLSEAQQNLRQAAEELRQALENGASDEEIQRLTEQLRQAMQEYMQAMAEEAARQQQQGQQAQQQQGQQQQGQPQDLNRMLDQIQQLAELGARDAARQLLNELQQMLENMQIGNNQQQQGQGQQGDNPMAEALQQLGEMIQQQQRLMDETFALQQEQFRQQEQQQGQQGQQQGPPQGQQGQQQSPQGQQPGQQGQGGPMPQGGQMQDGNQPGPQGQVGQQDQQDNAMQPGAGGRYGYMTPEELRQALGELQGRQQALQEQLQSLMQELQDQGMTPGEQLGEAEGLMGDAQRQLQQGEPSQAVEPQSGALQALRDTARNLAQQLAEMMQQQMQQGQGQQGEQVQNEPPEDPLGRPQANSGMDPGSRVQVPDQIDIQRAREILETIRRRLGESFRDIPELEYLERLLEE